MKKRMSFCQIISLEGDFLYVSMQTTKVMKECLFMFLSKMEI